MEYIFNNPKTGKQLTYHENVNSQSHLTPRPTCSTS